MATLREIRGRISGVKKTQKITKAMKMVAAAKLRRAQTGVLAARPYARKIKDLLLHLTRNPAARTHAFLAQRDVQAVALVVVTSDRGLCGAFNSNLLRSTMQHIDAHYSAMKNTGKLDVFAVGKKGYDFFAKRGFKIGGKYIGVYNDLVFARAKEIVREIVEPYLKGEIDKVEIVYNEFKSIGQQRIVIEQFLPIPQEVLEGEQSHKTIDYIYEPSEEQIMEAIIPKHLNFQIWRVLLESNAAEQGARMAAMDNATENANELISWLQLSYNKARQASITRELLEIVAGAEALGSAE